MENFGRLDLSTVAAALGSLMGSDAPAGSRAWAVVGRGALLGLGAAVPIGPVNVEIARRALRTGAAAGAAVGLGAVTVDVAYAVLSTFSFVRLLDRPRVVLPVAALGAALLAYLGVQCLRAAAEAWRHDPLGEASVVPAEEQPDAGATGGRVASATRSPPHPVRTAYLAGFLMTLWNPMTLAFWFTVVPATAGGVRPLEGADPAAGLLLTCAGVFIGTVGWVAAYSGLLAAAARAAGQVPARRRRWLAGADA
ncbi:MAG: Lysine exporter protein, partial [Phycisphaerales bacterium]|nr:Lysine exporter protein [Phycisphaerales bacterium]